MKKLLMAILLLVLAVSTHAQNWVFQSFDSSVKDGWWDMANLYSNPGDSKTKWDVTDVTTDKKEGTGCLQLDYLVGAGDGWGGYIVRTSKKPFENGAFYDLSGGNKIGFWYKVVKPVKMSTPGTMVMEVKPADIQDGQENRVYREFPVDFADASGQWKYVSLDFTMGSDKTVNWQYQAGPVDGRDMQWDRVNGFEMAIVYFPQGGGFATKTPTAEGTILFDGFTLEGDKYAPPLLTNVSLASKYTATWASGTGSAKLTDETADKVDGTTGSLKVDYTCDASEDWGGVMGWEIPVTKPTKFEERTGLNIFIKATKAATTTVPKRGVLRMYIFEGDNGEQWVTKIPIDLTKLSDWTRYTLPLKAGVNGKINGNESDQYPPVGTWARNPNGPKDDGVFNQEKITKVKFEVLAIGAGGTDTGPKGEKLVGTLLFGPVQNSGYQVFDVTAPSAPKNVAAVKGNFSNLISWGDVDNEGTEKYDVFAAKAAITDPDAKGVEKIATGIARGVQVYEHVLKSPKTNASQTWFYAVRAIDKNKNVGKIAATASVTNTAKGIPTVAIGTPNFKADGDLSEFKAISGIMPFQLKISNGTGFLATGDKNNGDADNSVEAAYVVIDKDYLYFGADVNDDFVVDDPKYYPDNTWQADAMELFIGMYDRVTNPTTYNYQRGKTPDYHLRFNKQKAREDHWDVETDELLLPGTNYLMKEKFPSGYTIEAKIALKDLATKRDANAQKKDVMDEIYVKEGYKIMFDLGVFDADNTTDNRKSRIFWTPTNNDNGYFNALLCGYTWIGNTDVISTDVEENEVPYVYSLEQNFPNPFNPATQIRYSLANAGNVSLKIYDVLGREVANLVNKHQEKGQYTVNFNASNLSSGVYIYRLESGSFTSIKKLMLVK